MGCRLSWGTKERPAHLRASGSQGRTRAKGSQDLKEPRFEGDLIFGCPYLWGATSVMGGADTNRTTPQFPQSRLGACKGQVWGHGVEN